MKFAIFFLCLCCFILLGLSTSLACSCAPIPLLRPNETDEQRRAATRKYFSDEFTGAAFVGKVIKREPARVNWLAIDADGKPLTVGYFRYTIEVREFWFGVESRTVYVYGEPNEPLDPDGGWSSCGFRLKEGKTFFFTPRLYKESLLIDMCDYSRGGSELDEFNVLEFRKVMGEPKSF